MNEFMTYVLMSGMNLGILFGFYWLFMRSDTFYIINRYYLVSSLFISLVFPFLKFTIGSGATVNYMHILQPVVITPQMFAGEVEDNNLLLRVIKLVYLVGSGFFLLRFANQLYQVNRLVRKYGIYRYKGLKLVVMEEDSVPFSMFNMIFIDRELPSKPGFDKVIEHERAHITQFHTIDLLLLELFLAFQWFNPFVWLTRRSVKQIHEYLADRHVLSSGFNAGEYQQLLLEQTLGMRILVLSNNFNKSLTKKRFIMMTKKRSSGFKRIKMILVIPAAIAITFILAVNLTGNARADLQVQDLASSLRVGEQTLEQPVMPQEEPVYTVVEQMPEFPGGQKALEKYMMDNIKYPENAKKNGKQGVVFISFVVEKSGKVTQAKVLKGVDNELDKEALRVVSEMPKWHPGKEKGNAVNVQFNLPVSFKLNDGAEKKSEIPPPPPRRQEIKKIDK